MQSPLQRFLTTLVCPYAVSEDKKLEESILLCGDVVCLWKQGQCQSVDGLILYQISIKYKILCFC